MEMKRILYIFGIIIAGASFFALCGCTNGTEKEQIKSESNTSSAVQNIDISNIYQDYCKDYKKVDVSTGKEITITAPDFEKIMQLIYEDGKPSNIDSSTIENKIKEHPEITKDYTFVVENDNQEQIEKQFYDMVMYDITITAYKNIDYSIEEED